MNATFQDLIFDPQLIRRFDVNGPRYTSYPTADRFVEAFDADAYRLWLGKRTVGGISKFGSTFSFDAKDPDQAYGELVSALGGGDVGIVQPSYSILPAEDGDGTATCDLSGQPDILTEEFVVDHIPFECAVPMLVPAFLAFPSGGKGLVRSLRFAAQ